MKENTKPTQEEKEQYFATHWGQKIHWQSDTLGATKRIVDPKSISGSIELTPISDITDEDAIEVAKIIYRDIFKWSLKEQVKLGKDVIQDMLHGNFTFEKTLELIDFLRSRSYAIKWRNYTVEQLISFGWLKLRVRGGDGDGNV